MRTPTKQLIAFILILTLALALPSAGGAAPVAITGADQREVMITVYNGNLGLVKDVREIRLEPGVTEAHFADVAAQHAIPGVQVPTGAVTRFSRVMTSTTRRDRSSSKRRSRLVRMPTSRPDSVIGTPEMW